MNRKFVAALSCLALAGTGVGIAQAAPATDRIGGIDRYDTAVQIAARTFTGHQNTVYIARGDLPVDALVAGQLTDGPVLLSPLGQVNPRTLQALKGYSPKEIIFLGKAFPASTINAYQIPGAQSWVMGGKDRQETSALIAGRAFNGKSLYHLYVAAPDGVDAVASGALTDAPIVLAYPDGRIPSVAGLPANTARVCIGAACNYVSAKERVQGKDRFETAELLAKRAFPNGFTRAYVGRSDNFIDAVVGGTLTDAPILLVHPSGHGNDRINALNLAHVTFLGGPGALPDNVLTLKPQPKPKPTSGLGLPWSGKINPLFAGTGAFGPFVFSEYVEAYSWAQIAGLYGWSANLSAEDAVAKLQSQGIVSSRSVTNENWTVQSVIFDKNWKPYTPPVTEEMARMSVQQKASYIQAHRDKLEVLIAQKLSERLQAEEGTTLNLTRDFTLINPYREWASGMPRDLQGSLNLARVDKKTDNDNNELGKSIQHFRYLPDDILVQVMPSYRGSLVRDGILAMVDTGSSSTLDYLAKSVADEYWSSSVHWDWVKQSGAAGTPFSCGVSAITDHGPWFRPDSNGVMAGDGRLTVACGSSINSLNRIP
ncbi:cell wall-binding repeat-containing protein [Mobiluncus curtisii]|uniref:cell wall-binding repeat-containing protein n=1 Tax=Mobiluncus curtisii TaxID=2051 RepID=UPI00146FE081|nr:cell wall-binding repeat-containing protein [Mobiluncus curtisii]NMW99191.1 cell wall-binding repeat-containing protein [Mobiluncus curtisii]